MAKKTVESEKNVEHELPPAQPLMSDPTKGTHVLLLPNRSKRPEKFDASGCFFCPGNEHTTPPATLTLPNKNGKNWRVRAFPNKFKVTHAHEVVVETNEHDALYQNFDDEQLALVFRAYKERYNALCFESEYVLLFKNHGKMGGASIGHEHAQIIAFDFVPEMAEREWTAFDENKKIFQQLLAEHERDGFVFAERGCFAAFTPKFARFPGEVWIVPRKQFDSFCDFDETETRDFAALLRDCLKRVASFSPEYNFVFHCAPQGREFWFHAEIYPRSSVWAGVELGCGVIINPKSANDAVEALKNAK
jgi:UDPglucose--hexose-1-phosphate uridylyltransferase